MHAQNNNKEYQLFIKKIRASKKIIVASSFITKDELLRICNDTTSSINILISSESDDFEAIRDHFKEQPNDSNIKCRVVVGLRYSMKMVAGIHNYNSIWLMTGSTYITELGFQAPDEMDSFREITATDPVFVKEKELFELLWNNYSCDISDWKEQPYDEDQLLHEAVENLAIWLNMKMMGKVSQIAEMPTSKFNRFIRQTLSKQQYSRNNKQNKSDTETIQTTNKPKSKRSLFHKLMSRDCLFETAPEELKHNRYKYSYHILFLHKINEQTAKGVMTIPHNIGKKYDSYIKENDLNNKCYKFVYNESEVGNATITISYDNSTKQEVYYILFDQIEGSKLKSYIENNPDKKLFIAIDFIEDTIYLNNI